MEVIPMGCRKGKGGRKGGKGWKVIMYYETSESLMR